MKANSLREAAEASLDALKEMRQKYGEYDCRACDHADVAIIKLCTALAEPVQEPLAWVYASIAGSVALHIVKPVGVAKASFIQSKLDNDMQVAKEYPNAHSCTPLYAAPPQRKPLAEWQINDLMADIDPEDVCSWSFRQGVYAAEKHHGVKP